MSRFFCLLLLLGTFSTAIAQPTWGVHAGPNYSWNTVDVFGPKQTADNELQYDGLAGASLGVTATFRKGERLQWVMGLSFTAIGAQEQVGLQTDCHTSRLYYATVPVVIRYEFLKNFQVGAGPGFHVLIDNPYYGIDNLATYAPANQRMDITGILELRSSITERFGIAIRYHHGFFSNYTDPLIFTDEMGQVLGEYGRYNKYMELRLEMDFL